MRPTFELISEAGWANGDENDTDSIFGTIRRRSSGSGNFQELGFGLFFDFGQFFRLWPMLVVFLHLYV